MKVQANTLRAGNVIEYNDRLFLITHHDIMQPGKGAAVIQIEMRDVRNGNKDNVRFRTQETIERVRLDQAEFQFLYKDPDGYHFMNQETYDQIVLSGEVIGTPAQFLQEGMIVTVESYESEALRVEIPATVIMEIVEADPVIKGQTATTSYKPAVLENGTKVMVPPFIDRGTKIVVRTEDGTYLERAK
jgi:elongation factor P